MSETWTPWRRSGAPMRCSAPVAILLVVLTAGCGDVSVAGLPLAHTDEGELTLYVGDSSPRTECVERTVLRIAQAYQDGTLPRVRARVDAMHPRFRAVAESERAELLLPGGTRLLIPLGDRIAAAVDSNGAHRLLEIPASMALDDCRP